MAENAPVPPSRPGCVQLIGLFLGAALGAMMLAMLGYVLFVEQLGWITVRREFSYEMFLVWAPLAGMVTGFATTLWASRGGASPQRTALWAIMGLAIALGGLLVFFGLGAIL